MGIKEYTEYIDKFYDDVISKDKKEVIIEVIE